MPRPLARIAGALLGAALAGMVVPADRAVAQTARTTPVVNRAAVAYVDGDGLSGGDAATVTVTVTHQAGVTLASPLAVSAGAGTQVVLAHTLTNTGTDADPIVLQATGPAGWPFLIYRDSDGSGTLTAADTPVAAPLALAAGQSAALLVVTTVPAGTPAGAVSIMLRATSGVDAAAVATLTDQVTVTATPTGTPGATVTKVVDRAHAAAGDTLHYTISFAGTGDAPTPAATLADPLPAGLAYVPGSLRLGAAALTDAADADAGTVTTDDAGRATVQVTLGPIAPGATGTVTFAAVLQRGAAGALTNVAALSWGDTTIASTPAATGVAMPELTLAKSVVGRDSVRVGGEVRFELRYGNASTSATATGVALVDTLPAELAFVSAEGSPTVAGQVVTWTLGDVAPGASGTFALVTRAVAAPAAGGGVVNHAMLEGSNASSAAATAQPLTVRAFRGDELSLAKTAGLLQAGLGDAVPYALTLRNTGTTALAGIVVRDRLPEGLRYLPDATVGADSTRVGGPNGTELTFFVAAPLAPGATQVVRYAAMVASAGRGNSFTNVAIAEAEDGTVRSDSARAEVQRRRGFAMQGKTLIGKVWLDRDGDGRQHGDEPGIAGVRIISADGQIVTTDKEGRYSFRDLPPSTQALRLDPRGVPAGLMLAKPGDEVVVVRADGWTTPRVDFRLVLRPLPQVASTTVPDVGALPPVLDAALMPPTDSAAHAAPATETVAAPAAPADSTAPRWISAATLLGTTASAAPAVAPARPAVRITSPGEGSVIGTNKVYVGVQGEPGSEVTLYDGGEKIAQATLRPDGRADFVAVELTEGDHVLRTTMRTPDGREEWNDVFVHRSGAPNWLELAGEAPVLHVDDAEPTRISVRVLDRWDVPLVTKPAATVEAHGVVVEGTDADPSSVGEQRLVDQDGWLVLLLRPGSTVAPGLVKLTVGDVKLAIPFRVLPSARPFTATGVGLVGVGAAPESFGAVTVQGALGRETAVSMSFDSRRGRDRNDYFGRGYDPLDDGRYATYGDGSDRRVLSSATGKFSARIEHGFDWLELGDVQTTGFGQSRLGAYQRSLTGVRGRFATGPVVWTGFGSVTHQALERQQLRGDGSSGPFVFGGGIRPGTERVAIEVRAYDNAARLVTRQELVRYTDYEVDYATGAVLLRQPVASVDLYGNPVYVVATVERESGGAAHTVGGLRMETDVSRLLFKGAVDSLGVGLTGVRDGAGNGLGVGSADLVGADVRLRERGFELGAELLHARSSDSTALATRADAGWRSSDERLRVDASWLRVGGGFGSALDPRLASALTEVRLGGDLRLTEATTLQLRHERQQFRQYGVERRTTSLRATEAIGGRRLTQEFGLASDVRDTSGTSTSLTGKVSLEMTQRLELWVDGSHPVSGDGVPSRPDQVGVGAGYRFLPGARLEATHRWVRLPGDTASYGITAVGVRTAAFLGGQVRGELERVDGGSAGDNRASHAAVLGWNQRLALAGGWSLSTLFERRIGLSRAAISDPLRALPFVQDERNRWSVGAGLEWLPAGEQARFSFRGEAHDGQDRRGFRLELAGDAPLGASAALVTLHDWSRDRRLTAPGAPLAELDRSLLGFAFRPVRSDRLNGLFKLEYRRTVNPLAGTVLENTVAGTSGRDARLIGAAEAVWAVAPETEIAGRYAMRWTESDLATGGLQRIRLGAHFAGMRLERGLAVVSDRLRARVDGRMLMETESGAKTWNVAPSLAWRLDARLELEAGYRFGDLQDADFGARGGQGLFAAMSLRFTEKSLKGPGAFWRERVAREP